MLELKEALLSETSSPLDYLKFNILFKRDDALQAITNYDQFKLLKAQPSTNILLSRVRALFRTIKSSLKRNLSKEQFEELIVKADSSKVSDALELFDFMEDYLDKMKVTRVDLFEVYDRSNVEDENKRRGC